MYYYTDGTKVKVGDLLENLECHNVLRTGTVLSLSDEGVRLTNMSNLKPFLAKKDSNYYFTKLKNDIGYKFIKISLLVRREMVDKIFDKVYNKDIVNTLNFEDYNPDKEEDFTPANEENMKKYVDKWIK